MNNSSQSQIIYTPIQVLMSDFLTTKKDVENNVVQMLKDIVQIKNNKKYLKKDDLKSKLKEKRELLQGIKRKLSDSAKKQDEIYDVCKKRLHKTSDLTQTQKIQNNMNKNIALFILQKTNLKLQKKSQQGEIQEQIQKIQMMEKKYLDLKKLFNDALNNYEKQQNMQLDSEQEKQVSQLIDKKEIFLQEIPIQDEQNISLAFQKTLNLQSDINLECDLFVKFKQISDSIKRGDLSLVKMFIYENAHMISKLNSDLQLWVTLCQAIQLIQKGQVYQLKAINLIRQIVQKNPSKIRQEHKKQLKKVTSMLLLQKDQIQIRPFLNSANEVFLKISQQIYRLPPENKLNYLLSIGASILKAPCCQFEQKQDPAVCPLCCSDSHKLFRLIPILTRNESMLKCRINNQVMNESNYPICLPNGQIYSYNGLQSGKNSQHKQKGKQTGEMYYCKTTNQFFNKNDSRRIFIA